MSSKSGRRYRIFTFARCYVTLKGMGDTDYKSEGLFQRYSYERTDGKPLDRGEQLFALRYDKDDPWGEACRQTLRDHADRIEAIGYEQLAAELRQGLVDVERRIAAARAVQPAPEPVNFFSPQPVPEL